jgi:glycosyltransferase involved in cell wall biosynthesis
VPRLHAAADAFVLPSLCEGWSLALGEALAAGLPAAATAVGSAPDLLPRCGGRLIRPPFNDIAEVDYATLGKYACRDGPEFVAEIAAAMEDLCHGPGRRPLPDDFRRAIDCRWSYKPYSRIFRWLMQGGPPAAARAWTFGRRAEDREMPAAEPAAA